MTRMPDPDLRPRLDIWYLCDLSLCNFDCAYCASGTPDKGGPRTRDTMWQDADGPQRLDGILRWVAALPYAVGLRLQTVGEPFVSEDFLAAAARMTREPNIRFVELVTNGSLLTSRLGRMLDQHGADPAKLTLWITYHHTEITAERLVDNAIYAARYGVFVVVNALLFPDTIEPIARLHRLCAAHDLRTNVDLGQDFNDAYAGSPFIPLAGDAMALPAGALAQNVKMAQLSVVAAASPQGLACSAGHDYVFINRRGEVYPCLGYLRYRPGAKLGCALDPDFVLSPRAGKYAPCAIAKGCTCKEDFLHLEAAAPGPSREHSLGYWPPSADATIDPVLTQRLDRIKQSAVLDDAPFWSRHINGRVTPG
jgi:MoaA/NifB/PqqE/SkfB family radical SAM enzyme